MRGWGKTTSQRHKLCLKLIDTINAIQINKKKPNWIILERDWKPNTSKNAQENPEKEE